MKTLRNSCIACVKVYRWTLSPLFMSLGVQCRFSPSCSEYSRKAFELHGAGRGLFLTLKRILRCHPFCHGGHDPVPMKVRLEIGNG